MKKIFTLCILAISILCSDAQVVLNEVYTDPGANKHEFFEFYNTSTNPTPESMDNYTLVAYYEVLGTTGFFVMDLPNLTVGPKGYFVGASANPYSVQGQNNLTPNFSWSAIPAGGYLKKFERNGAVYNEVALPANLNDIFIPRTGSGAVQHIMIFKNGILVNGIIGGTNFAVVPSYLETMPPLFVDMSGSSIDFLINFNSYNDNQFEYITSVPGNDNGYIRLSDGKCGVWDKSTSAVTHTPGQSNGSATGISGDLTISAYITELGGDYTKALLVYNVTAASLSAFPVTIEVYTDNGMIGELDATDVLIDSRIIYTTTAGDQYVVLADRTQPVMLVAKTPSGCFDQLRAIPNALPTLPVHLLSFQGNLKNNKVTLNWSVADNETVDRFEIEKSTNGRDFNSIGVVFASEKLGVEKYMFYEMLSSNERVMYRLRMIDKQNDIDYSKILVFQTKTTTNNEIKIIGNPVNDKLTFNYTASSTQVIHVRVVDMSGKTVMSNKVNSMEGSNTISLSLNSSFRTGMYVVEVNNGTDRQTAKFVKH